MPQSAVFGWCRMYWYCHVSVSLLKYGVCAIVRGGGLV